MALEFLRALSPSGLVIGKRVNELGGLVHLTFKLVGFGLHLLLNILLLGILCIETCLLSNDSGKFFLGTLELRLGKAELSLFLV